MTPNTLPQIEAAPLPYRVKPLREAGLEAKWTRTHKGAPIIVVRNPNSTEKHQRERWYRVDQKMFDDMQKVGILEAFDRATLLADIFSI